MVVFEGLAPAFERLKAALKRFKALFHTVIAHDIFKGIMEFLLMLGILFFAVSGALVMVFQTDSYWMAVISGSMAHEDDSWKPYYENLTVRQRVLTEYSIPIQSDDILIFDTSQFPLQGGFEKGDLLVIQGVGSASDISVGDVLIIDRGPDRIPLTHRVLATWSENGGIRFTTKGDHNHPPYQDGEILSDDRKIYPGQITGKVAFVIPGIGNIALWLQGR